MCPEIQDREENSTLKTDGLEEGGVREITILLMFLNCYSGSKGREDQKVGESGEDEFKRGAVLSDAVPSVTLGRTGWCNKGRDQWTSKEREARALGGHPHEVIQDGQDNGCTWSVEEEFDPGQLTIWNVME